MSGVQAVDSYCCRVCLYVFCWYTRRIKPKMAVGVVFEIKPGSQAAKQTTIQPASQAYNENKEMQQLWQC